MLDAKNQMRRSSKIPQRKILKKLFVYSFPTVIGLEDVSRKLENVEADSLFVAMLHAFQLRPISIEEEACEAERVLEYIVRAFEEDIPMEIEQYKEVLLMLISEYDEKHSIRLSEGVAPHEFLRALLEETGIYQKDLVPDCFNSESQVSEFLHQRKGRTKLSYEQAVALGKRFSVDSINFLK